MTNEQWLIANELTTLNLRIASCESLAQTITDPEALRENARDLENYNHRKFQLLDKLQDSGSIALLDIETDLGLISVREAELATAEAAVTARKAAL